MLQLAHVVQTAFTLSAAALSELQHQHFTVVRDFVPPAVVSTLVQDVALLHAQAQHPQAHSMRLPLPCRAAPSPLPRAPLLAHAVRRPPHSPQAQPTAVPVPAAFACPCHAVRTARCSSVYVVHAVRMQSTSCSAHAVHMPRTCNGSTHRTASRSATKSQSVTHHLTPSRELMTHTLTLLRTASPSATKKTKRTAIDDASSVTSTRRQPLRCSLGMALCPKHHRHHRAARAQPIPLASSMRPKRLVGRGWPHLGAASGSLCRWRSLLGAILVETKPWLDQPCFRPRDPYLLC